MGTLAYFDCALLALRIRARCLISVGLMDDICPPSTILGAYNALEYEKELAIYRFAGRRVADSQMNVGSRTSPTRCAVTEAGLPAKLWPGIQRLFDSGGGIRTRDLRVMSPTSYQTAPPRGGLIFVARLPCQTQPPRAISAATGGSRAAASVQLRADEEDVLADLVCRLGDDGGSDADVSLGVAFADRVEHVADE